MKRIEKVERPIISMDEPITVDLLRDACLWVQSNHERLKGYRTRANALRDVTIAPFYENATLLLRTDLDEPRFRFPDGFNDRAAAMVRADMRAVTYNAQYEADRLKLEEEIDTNLAIYEPRTRVTSQSTVGINHLYNQAGTGFQTHGLSLGSERVAEGVAQELSIGPSARLYLAGEDPNHIFTANVLHPLVTIEFVV